MKCLIKLKNILYIIDIDDYFITFYNNNSNINENCSKISAKMCLCRL